MAGNVLITRFDKAFNATSTSKKAANSYPVIHVLLF